MNCDLFRQLICNDTPFADLTIGERAGLKKHAHRCQACLEWLRRRVVMASLFASPETMAANMLHGAMISMRDELDPEAR